ncbi:hypothetical protein [Micromonospora sp. NPDC000729]|uniref:hypothetical protein n=1 Tax=Micromonospora sp. NPDC000729 TaxID=3364220 RepID=UPI0036B0E464
MEDSMPKLSSCVTGSRLVVRGGDFVDEVINDRELDEIVIADSAKLNGIRFDRLRIGYGSLGAGRGTSVYINCEFVGCTLNFSSLGQATFIGCRFSRSKIKGWLALSAEFVNCQFSSRLERVVFDARPSVEIENQHGRAVNRYIGNDFTDSEFVDVSFRGGVDLSRQVLPSSGEGFYIVDALRGYEFVLEELRQRNESWIKDLAIFVDVRLENARRGQLQDYVSPRDVARASTLEEARSLLMGLLDQVSERV